MLINKIIKQLILYILFFCSCSVFAYKVTENSSSMPWVTLDGPTDRMQYMQSISLTGSSTTKICSDQSLTYNLGRVQYTPVVPFKETTKPHTTVQNIFDIGYMGLAVMPWYVAVWFNQPAGEMINTGHGLPGRSVSNTSQTLWIGTVENVDRGFYWGYQTYIYKSAEQFEPGVFTIPKTLLYYMDCYDTEGALQERYEFYSSQFQITSNVTSCTPAAATKIINMDGIPIATVENLAVGALFGAKQQNFSLNCDPNIQVKFAVNDLLNPSNVGGTVATLESGGATGVGYIVTAPNSSYPNGYTFSPVGVTTPGSQNLSQYTIAGGGISGSAPTNVVDHTLIFSYIKTSEEVTEGKANAIIGITYSYQ